MAKIAGVDVVVMTKVSDVLTVIGGQTGATLNREIESFSVTSKDSGGWAENMVGNKSWSIECEGYVVVDNNALDALVDAWENRTLVDVEISLPNDKKYSGKAYVTEFPIEAPQDDAVTYSITLTGSGPLTKTELP
jgi:TP901-1 family phage major tail protein